MLNSKRFINSYNKIDMQIRNLYNFKSNVTFSDMVRKTVALNHIVRKYENALIDYGRLRNAIVHKSIDELVIAEPNDVATAEIEKIERLICTPPSLMQSLPPKEITLIKNNTKLKQVINIMSKSNYSNIPIVDESGRIIGIVNNKRLIENIGKQINLNVDIDSYLNNCEVKDIVRETDIGLYYEFLPVTATLDEILHLFEQNKKLLAILITERGDFLSKIVNMITAFDLTQINKILEDF